MKSTKYNIEIDSTKLHKEPLILYLINNWNTFSLNINESVELVQLIVFELIIKFNKLDLKNVRNTLINIKIQLEQLINDIDDEVEHHE